MNAMPNTPKHDQDVKNTYSDYSSIYNIESKKLLRKSSISAAELNNSLNLIKI